MSELAERLTEEFADKEYAHAYLESHESSRIATQIKVLREQRGLTQEELATLAGMKQERISALEDVNYDSWTVSTLRKLARAIDVHLHVGFVPFRQGILDVANLSRKTLEVKSREEDLQHFAKLTFRADGDGNWQAISPTALARVVPLKTTMGPVNPSSDWQSVPVVKKVMRG